GSPPIVRLDLDDGRQQIEVVRWGLIHYCPGTSDQLLDLQRALRGYRELTGLPRGIPASPLLVPLGGFYEWKKLGGKDKQPYAITLKSSGLMTMAGLWDLALARGGNRAHR